MSTEQYMGYLVCFYSPVKNLETDANSIRDQVLYMEPVEPVRLHWESHVCGRCSCKKVKFSYFQVRMLCHHKSFCGTLQPKQASTSSTSQDIALWTPFQGSDYLHHSLWLFDTLELALPLRKCLLQLSPLHFLPWATFHGNIVKRAASAEPNPENDPAFGWMSCPV